jgi:hypothetical protein
MSLMSWVSKVSGPTPPPPPTTYNPQVFFLHNFYQSRKHSGENKAVKDKFLDNHRLEPYHSALLKGRAVPVTGREGP